uniref:Uncharacterized protein n=1 Tax=Arundo donax TaxID=35708 RepID=A0A0A9AWX5_ARUDO
MGKWSTSIKLTQGGRWGCVSLSRPARAVVSSARSKEAAVGGSWRGGDC